MCEDGGAMKSTLAALVVATFSLLWTVGPAAAQTAELRIGIIGTDTSHVTAFTKLLNDKSDPDHLPGARVVAAFKGGSPDTSRTAATASIGSPPSSRTSGASSSSTRSRRCARKWMRYCWKAWTAGRI